MHESLLQESLSRYEAGALLDADTPGDDHCLFHALCAGGLIDPSSIPTRLTIGELRRMALSTASTSEIEVAAIAADVSVKVYTRSMVNNAWGDQLMLVCLARCLKTKTVL